MRTDTNTDNVWLASGFVGSNFGNNADPASTNVGGSFRCLWKNKVGAGAISMRSSLEVAISANTSNVFIGPVLCH